MSLGHFWLSRDTVPAILSGYCDAVFGLSEKANAATRPLCDYKLGFCKTSLGNIHQLYLILEDS